MILIVGSTKDVAGMNIANLIIDHYRFERMSSLLDSNPFYVKEVGAKEVRLVFIDVEIIDTQFIAERFSNLELVVFVSRHSSQSGIPTLSVHTPGNLTVEAEFGGYPKRVSVSPASAMKNCLLEMTRLKDDFRLDYEVSYECTHHGPSLNVPTMFAELGSSLRQWKDLKAAEAVAHATMYAISKQSKYQAVLGIGGPHYNDKFTRVALTSMYAFGHIIPKYVVSQIDYDTVSQCVERTLEKIEAIVLDWKGIKGTDKQSLTTILNKIKVPTQKI